VKPLHGPTAPARRNLYLDHFKATIASVGRLESGPPPKEMLEALLVAFREQVGEQA
jgi:hypothetical protein